MRQGLFVLLGLLFLAVAPASRGLAQQNTSGAALLIGNAVYPDADSPLTEPVKDARDLAEELRRRGFEVTVGENLKKAPMQKALDELYAKTASGSTAVIFFSGFGVQSEHQSYLLPVDAQIWNESDVKRDGFSLDSILAELTRRGAKVKVAIIDASRRNPFERRFRSVSAGLAAITATRGAVVMTSAPPDTVVDTNPPVFVSQLVSELKTSDSTIEQTLNRTRMDVSRQTNGQQVPWFSSSLDTDVPLGRPSGPVAAPAPATSTVTPPPAPAQPVTSTAGASAPSTTKVSADPEAEARHDYVVAENTGTRAAWDDFVAKHPSGYYHDLAVQQIAKLTPATKTASGEDTPTDLPGFYRRGQHRAVAGQYTLAIADFTEVIRRDPKHAGALNDRCWVRALVGELPEALKDCNAALAAAPKYPDALDSRGLVYLKLGKLTNAIVDYDAALALDPKHASALYGRGIAKRRNGDSTGADDDIAAAKAITPTIADEFAGYGIK